LLRAAAIDDDNPDAEEKNGADEEKENEGCVVHVGIRLWWMRARR
jgi:hypothetical protein